MNKSSTIIVIGILLMLSLAGCDVPNEKITATTKDIPQYNDEGTDVVVVPQKEATQSVDLSEYVKKEDVQKMIDSAVKEAVAEALENGEKSIEKGENGEPGPKGEKGEPGRGIVASTIDPNGNLILAYSDGTFANVGMVKGEKGDKGDRGDKGDKGDQGEKGDKGERSGLSKEEAEKKAAEDAAKAAEEAAKAAEEAAAAAATAAAVPSYTICGVAVTPTQYRNLLDNWKYATPNGTDAEAKQFHEEHHSANDIRTIIESYGW